MKSEDIKEQFEIVNLDSLEESAACSCGAGDDNPY